MRAVVTGAGGHVGTNLIRSLAADGHEVVAVDRRQPASPPSEGVVWTTIDVRDRAAMRPVLLGADVVFHLAAVISVAGDRGGLVTSVNVDGVRATALAALDAGVGRFVHCSSVHAYDLARCRGEIVNEDSPPATRPDLPAYDRSKATGQAALLDVAASGLDAVVINPTGVVGPLDGEPSRMGTVLRTAARGWLPATVRGSFDWVDVRDVVTALRAAHRQGVTGRGYLVGGHSASIEQIAEFACAAAGSRRPIADLPMWFARIWSPGSTAIARRWPHPLLLARESLHALAAAPHIDHSRATAELGHRPRPLADTVGDLVADFRARGLL